MTPEQKAAIDDLIEHTIDESQFCTIFNCQPGDVPEIVENLVKEAMSMEDGDALRTAFGLGYSFEIPDELIHLVHDMVGQTWHACHEDMIGMLQDWQNPESVGPIRAAIKLKPELRHLDYDDYGAFYNKCLWALRDICTEESLDAIKEYASSNDPVLREKARYRLKRIAEHRAALN